MKLANSQLATNLDIIDLRVFFQPIFNLREAQIVGVEALMRPIAPGGAFLAPALLFERARSRGHFLELERTVRYIAFRDWGAVPAAERPVLFVNFSSALLDAGELNAGFILQQLQSLGLTPAHVAIELVESGVDNQQQLAEFAQRNRSAGFLITLDDFGTEHSNLERVALVRPDIIKIDRSIASGVAHDELRRSVLRSIVYLARTIGALTLAEGIEDYEDLLTCVTEGVELGQGFLLGRPSADPRGGATDENTSAAQALARLRGDLRSRSAAEVERRRAVDREVDRMAEALGATPPENYDEVARVALLSAEHIECAYILDEEGVQISETILASATAVTARHPIFSPASRGTDLSRKDYASGIVALGNERYRTSQYVSLATGHVCRTVALRFTGSDGRSRILCADVPAR